MLKTIRFKIDLYARFIKKHFLVFGLGTIIGFSVFIAQKQIIRFINTPSLRTENIAILGLYKVNNLPIPIGHEISLGLTNILPNGRATASAAISSWNTEDEGKTYRFRIKDNLYWHSGEAFTAEDINYQISGAVLETVSEKEILIKLKESFSPLPVALEKPIFKKSLNGLGPYKVDKITFQKGYIKTLELSPLDSNLKKKRYSFYPNNQDLIWAYKLGEVDRIQNISDTQNLTSWPHTKINPRLDTDGRYLAIFFNSQKDPLTNKRIRQALSYSVPKTSDNNRCLGPISPNSWAYNPNIKKYEFDINHAKSLFEKETNSEEPFIINLVTTVPELLEKAESIKKSWEETLGISVKVTLQPGQIDPDFEALLAYGSIPKDPDQYSFWHSTQEKTNLTKLNNPRIDKLLEEGRLTQDPQERKRIYQDFQKFLLEESPVIFLSFPEIYTIIREN